MKVYLASPRGFCAGVERAIEIVERALDLFNPPVYVRKEIVHNLHVVEGLRRRGAIFVDELDQVPSGAVTIFSAHGVSPAVRDDASARGLRIIDATCPLVAKVHVEAIRYAKEGYTILMIGHDGHEEVEGTMGEAPERMLLVTSVDDVAKLPLPNDARVAVLTQTTLSVDDTAEILAAIRRRFPTAATRRRIVSRRSNNWRRAATWCSSSVPTTRPTVNVSRKSRSNTGRALISSRTRTG
jgi:4-hydroxy-3-methylbut-2-en-1-yl diphosphate reductase